MISFGEFFKRGRTLARHGGWLEVLILCTTPCRGLSRNLHSRISGNSSRSLWYCGGTGFGGAGTFCAWEYFAKLTSTSTFTGAKLKFDLGARPKFKGYVDFELLQYKTHWPFVQSKSKRKAVMKSQPSIPVSTSLTTNLWLNYLPTS